MVLKLATHDFTDASAAVDRADMCGTRLPQGGNGQSCSSANNVVGINVENLIVDISIVDTVRAYDRIRAQEVAYDWEIEDKELLPLSRMSEMMTERGEERPPISVARCGRLFKVLNGRHRVAYHLLKRIDVIPAIVVNTGRDDFLLAGGESNPGPPANAGKGTPSTSGNANHRKKGKAGKGDAESLTRAVNNDRMTRTYLRGRDKMYPDAAALARFNAWIVANVGQIDPEEQFVCLQCGHVDFVLCQHAIAPQAAPAEEEAVEIVPNRLRYHQYTFRPIRALYESLSAPWFDTHSQSDTYLHGFTNDDICDELIIPALFSYLAVHMQTSYRVGGTDDRALRLAHCHKLAERWLILRSKEDDVEQDHHYATRVRVTIQRAADNMQNAMIYEQRTPARNFGLAWLPGSRVAQICLVIAVLLSIIYWPTTVGLLLRSWQVTTLAFNSVLFILNFLGATVPDLSFRILVSATAPPPGKWHELQCVETEYSTRWHVPEGDAYAEIRSCSFSDWVTAGLNEASFQTSDTYETIWKRTTAYRDETCAKLWLENAGYELIWAGKQLADALQLGLVSPGDVLSLWFHHFLVQIRLLLFRC